MKLRSYLSAAVAALLLTACGATTPTTPTTSQESSSSSSESTMSSSSQQATTNSSESANWVWDGSMVTGKHTVLIDTSMGKITLELDATVTPKTVTNFMALASSGFYDKLTFHRVIPGFMIQGGDPNGDGTGGASIFGETFQDEINPANATYKRGYKKGVIAMANRGPNTNGSQFFIMDADYPLPPNYTIFGNVTAGQDVVHAIAITPRDSSDKPTTPVTFSVKVVK